MTRFKSLIIVKTIGTIFVVNRANLLKMKRFIISLVCIIGLSLGASSLCAQGSALKAIQNSVKASNASSLVEHFDSTVELTIGEQEGTYSKAQAEQIVRSFFQRNKATSFVVKHSGSSSMGKKYEIGTYKTSSKTFRTYVLISQKDGKYVIHQLRFEEE